MSENTEKELKYLEDKEGKSIKKSKSLLTTTSK